MVLLNVRGGAVSVGLKGSVRDDGQDENYHYFLDYDFCVGGGKIFNRRCSCHYLFQYYCFFLRLVLLL